MEKSFASFTIIIFLLFAVSTARISLNPPATNLPAVQSTDVESKTLKSLPGPTTTEDSNIILPSETQKPISDESGHKLKPEENKARVPRSDYARFHAINRHFFDEHRIPLHSAHRRPSRHFVNSFAVPRSEISHRSEAASFGETSNVDAESFHRKAPVKPMKAKRDYGHRHYRHKYHHHIHHDSDGVYVPKHMFSREKGKSLVHQHDMEKKAQREHEASFMKGIRKFLKHTFD